MENDEVKPIVKLPEALATQVSAHLRQGLGKRPFALSVYAFVNKKGVSGINIQVDYHHPTDGVQQYELNYNAKAEAYAISKHAKKRILAQFDL